MLVFIIGMILIGGYIWGRIAADNDWMCRHRKWLHGEICRYQWRVQGYAATLFKDKVERYLSEAAIAAEAERTMHLVEPISTDLF